MEDYQKQLYLSNAAVEPLGNTIEVTKTIEDETKYDVTYWDKDGYSFICEEDIDESVLPSAIRSVEARIINNAKDKIIDTFDRLGENHQIDLLCALYIGLTDAQKDKFLRDTGNP